MTHHALVPPPDRTVKVRVDVSVLEKRNFCMAMDARVEDKKGRAKIVGKICKMDPCNVDASSRRNRSGSSLS